MPNEYASNIFPQSEREWKRKSDLLLTYPQDLFTENLIIELDGGANVHVHSPQWRHQFENAVHKSRKQGIRTFLSVDNSSEAVNYCADLAQELSGVVVIPHGTLDREDVGDYYDWLDDTFRLDGKHTTLMTTDLNQQSGTALAKGMGIIAGKSLLDVFSKTNSLVVKNEAEPFEGGVFIAEHYRPKRVNVIGIMGHTGAGKTTLSHRIHEIIRPHYRSSLLHMDLYHAFDRKTRKAMLEQAMALPPEARRAVEDNENWFNFHTAREDLARLRMMEPIHRDNMYNQKTGEFDAELRISPNKKGHIILFEGIATHKMLGYLDTLLVVTTHPLTRLKNLKMRDIYRTQEERLQRIKLTQESEIGYLREASHVAGDTVFMTPNYRFYNVPRVGIL